MEKDKKIVFMDFNGEVLYSYTFDEFLAINGMPVSPNHEEDEIPLVFDCWSYSRSEIEAIIEESLLIDDDLTIRIGAIYHTKDDCIYLRVNTDFTTGMKFYLSGYTSPIEIDWGDSKVEVITKLDMEDISHTYEEKDKDYLIKIDLKDNKNENNTLDFSMCRSAKFLPSLYILKEAYLTQKLGFIDDYCFYKCSYLKWATIPNSIHHIGSNALFKVNAINGVYLPPSVSQIITNFLVGGNNIDFLGVPFGVKIIEDNLAVSCNNLKTITCSAVQMSENFVKWCYAYKNLINIDTI